MPNDTPPAPARRGRKPKFTSAELHERTLSAGIEAVVANGVAFGLDAVRIDQVIVEAETPRVATYDYWAAHGEGSPQDNLRRATVIEFLTNVPAGSAESTAELVFAAAAAAEDLDAASPEERRTLRNGVLRLGARHNHDLLQDQRWLVYKTLVSAIATKNDEELRAAVATGEERLIEAYGVLFRRLAEIFSLVLREPFSIEHFVMSAYALNEGLSNRLGPTYQASDLEIDGEPWSVFAVGLDALIDKYFVEAIPPAS